MSKGKWAIVAGAVAAAVAIVIGLGFGVSAISAQEPTPTPVPQQTRPADHPRGGSWEYWMRQAGRYGWRARGEADLTAEALGMSTEDLAAALRQGQTVAELAAEQGIPLEDVVEALVAPRRQALQQAVAEGRLTQAEADEMLKQLEERIAERLQEPMRFSEMGPAGRLWQAQRRGWEARGEADLIAETLGISTEDLMAALRRGQTVAELAAEQGVPLEDVVGALAASRREALQQAVAEGRLTQAEADEMLKQLEERIAERLQRAGLPIGGTPRRPMGHGGGQGDFGARPMQDGETW